MGKEQNLTPWQSGQSGNPKGRPKGSRNRSTIVREWLEAKATDGEDGQVADQLVRALIKRAAQGDVSAFRELFDSGFGKLTDKVDTQHSYTHMGRIMTQCGETKPVALTFDVGEPVKSIDG